MKKALSVLLSVLVIFSMVGVMAFAAEEPAITVQFKDWDGKVVKEIQVDSGTIITQYAPENPERADTDDTDYTFAGWRGEDGELYHKSTFPTPVLAEGETTKTVVYTAEYTEKDTSGYQSFWNFIESIFERINMLFEYFAEVFNW
ncbi:MAG: hypothetical protein IJ491_05415 [Clostridia bacterium]|nr:hypothetical protein [Clostridia bacterium]